MGLWPLVGKVRRVAGATRSCPKTHSSLANLCLADLVVYSQSLQVKNKMSGKGNGHNSPKCILRQSQPFDCGMGHMWDLLDGPMPAAIPLCCCCAAKARLDSDICRMSLMMFCLSMGLGSETGRSSQKICGCAFCRSFKMSSSSEDCNEKRVVKT